MSAPTSLPKTKFYQHAAKGYAELYGAEQKKKFKSVLDHWWLPKDSLVLDIGCGTGLAKDILPGKFIGVDPAKAMLSFVKYPKVIGRAEHLPFLDNTFDGIICITAIHHVSSSDHALSEIRRVSKSNSLCAISVLKKSSRADILVSQIKGFLDGCIEIEEDKDIILMGRVVK